MLVCVSVNSGRDAAETLEDPVKGLLALESALHRDIEYCQICIFQQFFCIIDPQRVDVFVKSHMEHLCKDPGQIKSADSQLL